MEVIILALVVIAALSAITNGVWVATALISAISTHRSAQAECHQPNEKTNDRDT
jgi:hypothetical protein